MIRSSFLLVLLALTLLAPPAEAAGAKKPLPLRPLDLTLSAADLDPAPASAPAPGSTVTLADDPWRVLEANPDVGGIRIPQLDRDEPGTKGSDGLNQKLLVRVLDGETIPLLTIRVVPPPRPPQED